MKIDTEELLKVIRNLKKENIFHRLSSYRDDAICLEVVVPGEHWEINFLSDGSVEVEIFESDGEIFELEKIDQLFNEHSGKAFRSFKQG